VDAAQVGERAFDVVVVGSGSAGCVLAARLAAAGSRSVALVEAGPDLRADPAAGMHNAWTTYRGHGWGYESEAVAGRESEPLHRGKLVGGTSWVTRFAMRGSPADFDNWVRRGNPGWAFDDVLPYFRRLERDLDFGDQPWHGDAGPIPITRYPELPPSEYEAAVTEAQVATGFALIDDHNRPGAVGAGRMPRNGYDGRRMTAADAYLQDPPANLVVRGDSEVGTVVVEDGAAVGVRLVDGAVVRAGWVVLCAGTYGSPAILMRSGIGPADDLRALDIDVVVDLPGVGANLADHPGVDIELVVVGEARVTPGLFSLTSFHSSYAGPGDPPDLALWSDEPWGDPAEAAITAMILTPTSRGRVTLRSADPAAAPRITLPTLEDPADVARMIEAYERAWDVVEHPAVRRLCPRPVTVRADAADLAETVVRESWSFPHTVGTCAMGPDPAQAVVDAGARVHGIDRLSIVDASVIPIAPSGFPHLITIMLAERIADDLSSVL
jgi:choline dehydrogenase